MKSREVKVISLICLMAGMSSFGWSNAAKSTGESSFFEDGTVDLKFRYRIAHVDQKGFGEDALVGTLRTMLGYQTGTYNGFSAYIQVRNVAAVGPDDYNDTLNGKSEYPVEPDPEATEVDQAYLKFKNGDTSFSVGRRKLKLGNQRFISDLGWRQNNRSFDGVVLENSTLPQTKLFYAYAWNVNRAFTDDSPNGNFDEGTNIHLLNVAYDGFQLGKLEAYTYLLDLDGIASPNPKVLSTATFGFSLTGSQNVSDSLKINYIGEFAHQKDYADNDRDVSLNYYRLEAGIGINRWNISAGLEFFESDGVRAFVAPLGLLHAFGGWTDKFLPSPPSGMKDYYIKSSYTIKDTGTFLDNTKLVAHYHYFEADSSDVTYGSEIAFAVVRKFMKHYMAAFHFAAYDADSFSSDTTKAWFTLGANF